MYRQEERRKHRYRVDWLHNGSLEQCPQELIGAVEDRTAWTSLIHRVARGQSSRSSTGTQSCHVNLVAYYMFRVIQSFQTYRVGLISPTRSERCQSYSLWPWGIPLNWCVGMEGKTLFLCSVLILSGQIRFYYFFLANL